jgi:predicted peptidase
MRRLASAFALSLVALLASGEAQESPGRKPGGAGEAFQVREFRGSNNGPLKYSLFVPPTAAEAKLPLVLCLHGSGGNTAAANVLASPAMQKKHPCVVMAPSCDTKTSRWVDAPYRRLPDARVITTELLEALEAVIKEASVDPDRVYVTGQSMGGIGTWGLIARHADRFAAAVPVCGIWPPEDAAKMSGVAIWAFHGEQDPTVPVTGSRNMIEALKKAKVSPEPKYTELPGVGHGSWTPAYATTEMWDWLFEQRRTAALAK